MGGRGIFEPQEFVFVIKFLVGLIGVQECFFILLRPPLFGEEHQSTAVSYYSLGITQHELGDLKASVQNHQPALGIRIKLFGIDHKSTAASVREVEKTQRGLDGLKGGHKWS